MKISGFLFEASIYVHADFQTFCDFSLKNDSQTSKRPFKFFDECIFVVSTDTLDQPVTAHERFTFQAFMRPLFCIVSRRKKVLSGKGTSLSVKLKYGKFHSPLIICKILYRRPTISPKCFVRFWSRWKAPT